MLWCVLPSVFSHVKKTGHAVAKDDLEKLRAVRDKIAADVAARSKSGTELNSKRKGKGKGKGKRGRRRGGDSDSDS